MAEDSQEEVWYVEEEEEEAVAGGADTPKDDIRVAVKGFQQDADQFSYDIEVEVNGQTKAISRNYLDILWLYRWLTRRVELGGHILPPMPAPPPKTPDPNLLTLGDCPQTMFGSQTRTPCMAMETFLQTLADHPFFSENHTVNVYLTSDQGNFMDRVQDRLGRGSMWSQITRVWSDYQLSGVQETDEEFEKLLKHTCELIPLLQTASQNFSQLVASWEELAHCTVSTVEAMKGVSSWEKEQKKQSRNSCHSIVKTFCGILEEGKIFLHADALDASHTLGFTLDLYHNICLQAKEMLYRRLAKLQELLSATATLDKAKPEKKEAAETSRADAETAYNQITDVARGEMETLKAQYVQSFRDALTGYAESHVAHSRRTHENLTAIRDSLLNTQ